VSSSSREEEEGEQGESGKEGLSRRVCCLLSLPWVQQLQALPAYRGCGFPSHLPALAQSLGSCCGEYRLYCVLCVTIPTLIVMT